MRRIRTFAVTVAMTGLLAGCGASAGVPSTTSRPPVSTSTTCPPVPGVQGTQAGVVTKQCGTNGGGAV